MLEIVTEPDIEDPKEAREFLEKLRSILEHLGTCDCTIEGSMRVDVNVSVPGGERVEVKNIGSIKGVEEALKYEIARQEALTSQGLPVKRETRHWDDVRKVTLPSRYKEEETDYRYFPDPDLPPVTITENWIKSIASSLPELPDARIRRFMVQYGLSEYDATVLVMDKGLADFYEDVLKIYYKPKEVANLLINDYLRWINEMNIRPSESKAKPEYIAAVEKARRDPKVVNYLVGQVMRRTGKRADPYLVNQLVRKMLEG
jgi:aspartyl-tRNA(Asn)/glutamyl-tRNA(Gln) amidotransferase subunit B